MCLVTRRVDDNTVEVIDLRWSTVVYTVLLLFLISGVSLAFVVCPTDGGAQFECSTGGLILPGACHVDTSGYYPLLVSLFVLSGIVFFITSFHYQRTRFDRETQRADQVVISAWTKFRPVRHSMDIKSIGRFRLTLQEVLGNDARLMVLAPIISPDLTVEATPECHADSLASRQFNLSIPSRYACGTDLKRGWRVLPNFAWWGVRRLPTCGDDLDDVCHMVNAFNENEPPTRDEEEEEEEDDFVELPTPLEVVPDDVMTVTTGGDPSTTVTRREHHVVASIV